LLSGFGESVGHLPKIDQGVLLRCEIRSQVFINLLSATHYRSLSR
jgi:hypothetical protein